LELELPKKLLNAPVMPERNPPLFWARATERNGIRTNIVFILKK
jgi:hypothetical protein